MQVSVDLIFLCFYTDLYMTGTPAVAAPVVYACLYTVGDVITCFGDIFAWRQLRAPVPGHPGTLYSNYLSVGVVVCQWRRVASYYGLLRAPTLIGMTSACPSYFAARLCRGCAGSCVGYCDAIPSPRGRAERLHCATIVLVCGLSSYYG